PSRWRWTGGTRRSFRTTSEHRAHELLPRQCCCRDAVAAEPQKKLAPTAAGQWEPQVDRPTANGSELGAHARCWQSHYRDQEGRAKRTKVGSTAQAEVLGERVSLSVHATDC